jgi:EAL domain-containing protein (putative c-di-GMP-specific phosphodiesterase class I)
MEPGKNLTANDAALVDYDGVCQKIRLAMEPVRAHAISLHDHEGDLLWLTESSMGPDEHNAVHQGFEAFANGSGPSSVAFDLGDSRSAVLFRVSNAKRAMVGAAMLIVDTRALKQFDGGPSQLMTQKMLRALGEFGAMRRRTVPEPAPAPAPNPAPSAAAAAAVSVSPVARAKPAATAPSARAADQSPTPRSAPRPATVAELTMTPMSEIEIPLASAVGARKPAQAPAPAPARAAAAPVLAAPRPKPAVSAGASAGVSAEMPVTPEIDRLNAALRRSPIALHVQRLVPLSKGSKLRRFEVLLRSKSDSAPNAAPQAMLKAAVEHGLGSMIDRRVVTELIGWLVRHPQAWNEDGSMFSVNLTKTALHDEHFMKFVSMCLDKAALPAATIAFEVDVPTAMKFGSRITEVAVGLNRLGCPLVLDDFAMRTECFSLLRLPGVKYIKMAPSITSQMRTDKVSQAAITALVQMSRVLGLHTVAKRTESAAEQEWLTALGVDFIQSNALSPPVAIESLSAPDRPRRAP